MNVSDLQACLKQQLSVGLTLQIGPFYFSCKSSLPDIQKNISVLYSDYTVIENSEQAFKDFHITIRHPNWLRRYIHKQAQFYVDDQIVFNPFPLVHATAMLEWGMNWCVSTQIHTYLIIHAAVIEKNGLAAILPAPPGSGKSTLCASLIQEGWRLLSDELALIDLKNHQVIPMPRPVGLKNQSIDIIRQRYPDAVFGLISSDTLKGSVCHIKPPKSSIQNLHIACPVGWIIFPKYAVNSVTELSVKSKAEAFLDIANNAFNYNTLGTVGFDVLKAIVDRASCFNFKYSQLDEAVSVFAELSYNHAI